MLDIEAPRTRVVTLFLAPESLGEWQPDLVSFEPVSGTGPRDVGAVNRQVHRIGRREMEMTETIAVHDYPETFAAIHDADKVWNLTENGFVELSGDRTRWILDCAFKCGGMVRIMSVLFPGMFKKQTLRFMQMFEGFGARGGRVRHKALRSALPSGFETAFRARLTPPSPPTRR